MKSDIFLFLFVYLQYGQCHPKINGHLRVVSYSNPLANLPNVTINKVGTIEVNLLAWLSDELNFTYDICVPTDVQEIGSYETKGNGSWIGSLGLLVRDEADLSIAFGPESYSRFLAIDTTVTIILDTISIMLPYPTKNNDAASLFYVFDTWLLVIVAVIITLCIIPRLQQRGERNAGTITILILAMFFAQGGFLRQFSLAPRIVQGAFLLSTLVINYAYSGVLISMITAPTLKFTVNSIEDVAAIEDIRPLIINESNTQTEFEESTLPTLTTIVQKIKDDPSLLIPSSSDLLEVLLSDPRNVLIMSNLLADSEIEKDFRETGKCRATILPKPVNDRTNSLYLRKDSPYTQAFNKQLMLLRQAGLSDYLDSTYDTFAARCYMDSGTIKNKNRGRRPSALTLYELRGLFLTLSYALLFCVAVFICELLSGVYQRHCRIKK